MTIPGASFPHIVDAILGYAAADDAEPGPLVELRRVSRAWRARIDAKLGYHLLTAESIVRPPGTTCVNGCNGACGMRHTAAAGEGAPPAARQDDGLLRRDTLRPALYPGRDIGDLSLGTGTSLVHSAQVLTVTGVLTPSPSAAVERLCPSLRAVRFASVAPHGAAGASGAGSRALTLPHGPRVLPRAETYVWFRAPDTQFCLLTAAPGWRARSRPSPPRVCHEDTRTLVVINHPLPPEHRVQRADDFRMPRLAVPQGLRHVVFVLPGLPADGVEHWIRWACEGGFAVSVVIDADPESAQWTDVLEALEAVLGQELLGSGAVQTLSLEAYREQVGEEQYRLETQYYLSPNEKANESQNETRPKLPLGWAMPYDSEL